MKRILVLLIAVFAIGGCFGDSSGSAKLKHIILTANKDYIIANGEDTVDFKIQTIDQDGNYISADVTIKVNGNDIEGTSFKTTEDNDYIVQAYSGEVKSTALIISAEAPEVSGIDLKISKNTLVANGYDEIDITIDVKDQKGNYIDSNTVDLTLNGEEFSGNTFTTTIADNYVLRAQSGSVYDEVSIEAEEIVVTQIILTATNYEIIANGSDSTFLSTIVLDQMYHEVENPTVTIYKDSIVYEEDTFTTTDLGSVEFKAMIGGVVSNIITIKSKMRYVQEKKLEGHTDDITTVTFNRGGNLIASGSDDDSVKIWDLSTGEEKNSIEASVYNIRDVEFNPDSYYVVVAGQAKDIIMYNVSTGEEFKRFSGHSSSVNDIEYSFNGDYLASASDDNTIILWNAETGMEIRKFEGHTDDVTSVSFSTNNKYLATGSKDSTVKIWNVETGELIKTLVGHSAGVNDVCFSPDGLEIASASNDDTIKIWNFSSGYIKDVLNGHDDVVNSLEYSDDGKYIVSGSNDYTLRLWDAETGVELTVLEKHTYFVNAVCISDDGMYIVSGGSNDLMVRLWIRG